MSHRIVDAKVEQCSEILASEGPLHITLNGEAYVTTMRSPDSHDSDLARGLLYTEGIVIDQNSHFTFSEVTDPETKEIARLDIEVDPDLVCVPIAGRRNQMATSSCGICGTRDPADLELTGEPLIIRSDACLKPGLLHTMMNAMRSSQDAFTRTGGTHAAGAYTSSSHQLVVREDIGRHNAVDKVIGWLLKNKKLSDANVLTVSGRVSYEIITKAYRAQIPILVAVSAPSSMAVDTAQAFGITLVGFCREDRLTVYSHPRRIGISGSPNG